MPHRFQDHSTSLWTFRQRLLVVCPRCEGCATVVGAGLDRQPGRLTCPSCSLVVHAGENTWAGPILGRAGGRCERCGRAHPNEVLTGPGRPATRTRACPCGHESAVPVHWSPHHKEGLDPVFGHPLWLRTTVRGQLLWATNPAHLAWLKGYVSAGIRERTPNQNGSLASRLPRWLKARQNREAVLKGIATLEARLGARTA